MPRKVAKNSQITDNLEFVICNENSEYFEACKFPEFESLWDFWKAKLRLYNNLSRRPMIFLQRSCTYMAHMLAQQPKKSNNEPPPMIVYETDVVGMFTYQGYSCVFCHLDCGCIESLAMHYHNCHDYFNFDVRTSNLIKITINHSSKAINLPSSIHNWSMKYDEVRHTPSARGLITNVMVSSTKRSLYRQLKDTHELPEFSENRLTLHEYFHSRTGTRVRPAEFDENSETEEYEDWLKERNMMLIDSFSDVNLGEKNAMILWNSHFMDRKNKFFSEKFYPQALENYIRANSDEIIDKNIRTNILLQLSSLHKLGLVDTKTVYKLQTMVGRLNPNHSSR